MNPCLSLFVAFFAVLIPLTLIPSYPEQATKYVAQSLDFLDTLKLLDSLEPLDTFLLKKLNLNNHGAHFSIGDAPRNFFEGWYYKKVSADLSTIVITIPGIVFDREGKDPHAFIMHGIVSTVDGNLRKDLVNTRYPISEVSIRNFGQDEFELRIGPNVFMKDSISLDIDNVVRGKINFLKPVRYSTSIVSPSIMGFFSYVDMLFGMQCVHKVLAVDSKLEGDLEIFHGKRTTVNMENGRGYIEGDYGSEFPEGYVWISSNHFSSNRGSSVLLSFAKVPFPNKSNELFTFDGFLGFVYDARLGIMYKFGTYTGAVINLDEVAANSAEDKPSRVSFTIKDLQYIYQITAVGDLEKSLELFGPRKNNLGNFEMSSYVTEMLHAQVHVSIKRRADNVLVFEGIGLSGGLEIQL